MAYWFDIMSRREPEVLPSEDVHLGKSRQRIPTVLIIVRCAEGEYPMTCDSMSQLSEPCHVAHHFARLAFLFPDLHQSTTINRVYNNPIQMDTVYQIINHSRIW